MKFEKITKEVTRVIDVYVTEDGKEFECVWDAELYVAQDAYDKLEKYYIPVFKSDIFKCNTQEEFKLIECHYELKYGFCFEPQFKYTEAKYPIYCLYSSSGDVYKINEKLYKGLIKFIKEK